MFEYLYIKSCILAVDDRLVMYNLMWTLVSLLRERNWGNVYLLF
jgi:hypothetical protein